MSRESQMSVKRCWTRHRFAMDMSDVDERELDNE